MKINSSGVSRPVKLTPTNQLFYKNSIVCHEEDHKHLGLTLEAKLSFEQHLQQKIKANNVIGLLYFLPMRNIGTS